MSIQELIKAVQHESKPDNWNELSKAQQLEHIASRILAHDRRGMTGHNAIKATGIQSYSQMERRRQKEVYSVVDGLLRHREVQTGIYKRDYIQKKLGADPIRFWNGPGDETLEGNEYPINFWYSGQVKERT